MHLYDEANNPIKDFRVVHRGSLFLIAEIRGSAEPGPLLGLFVEDDESFHLKAQYSAYWSEDLAVVAQKVHEHYQSTKKFQKRGQWLRVGRGWECECFPNAYQTAGTTYCFKCNTHRPGEVL